MLQRYLRSSAASQGPLGAEYRHLRCASVAAAIPNLLGRAHHRTVRTEDAAIPRLGPQDLIAVLAFIEELARVRWHRFDPYMSTGRTGQFALKNWTGHGSLAQNLTVADAWSVLARRVAVCDAAMQ